MLHERPGHLVHVRPPVRPGVVQEKPLAALDGGLGPEVALRVVGGAHPVLSNAPGPQKLLERRGRNWGPSSLEKCSATPNTQKYSLRLLMRSLLLASRG